MTVLSRWEIPFGLKQLQHSIGRHPERMMVMVRMQRWRDDTHNTGIKHQKLFEC
ncbi:MAG: hypothetical protein AB7P76_08865 [Candidatus Melainabacteria bacterium]